MSPGLPRTAATIDAVLAEAGSSKLPKVNRVVLVGNKISPGNPVVKADGTVVRTLWGELAWQLGHAAAAQASSFFASAGTPVPVVTIAFRLQLDPASSSTDQPGAAAWVGLRLELLTKRGQLLATLPFEPPRNGSLRWPDEYGAYALAAGKIEDVRVVDFAGKPVKLHNGDNGKPIDLVPVKPIMVAKGQVVDCSFLWRNPTTAAPPPAAPTKAAPTKAAATEATADPSRRYEGARIEYLDRAGGQVVASAPVEHVRWEGGPWFGTCSGSPTSSARLLTAVSAPQADEIEKMKMELLRVRFDEQMRGEKRKSAGGAIETQAAGALKPWREVVSPHPDVASGRYQQAEFAADLWQVHIGEGSDEYRKPVEFFRRTYLTDSLKRLLTGAVQRLNGSGGDPVVQLQTNFGGGKTHSMLALYHLFSSTSPKELVGIDAVLAEAGSSKLPKVNRVVLVGNKISPGNPVVKADGTVVRTLWGELAWQLGHAAGGAKEAKKPLAWAAVCHGQKNSR